MSDVKKFVEKLPFWDNLSTPEKEFVIGNAEIQDCNKGEMLFSGKDSCLGMLYLISGEIRVNIISEDGREISLFRIKPGEVCVLSASCVMHQITFETSMSVESDTEILVLDTAHFAKLADQNIYVRCFMYELAAERFSQVMWVLQQIVFSRFDKRLASFLVEQVKDGKALEIIMTQDEIAKNVNSAREVVTRMLKNFSEDGYVELKRGKIIVRDLNALSKIAEV